MHWHVTKDTLKVAIKYQLAWVGCVMTSHIIGLSVSLLGIGELGREFFTLRLFLQGFVVISIIILGTGILAAIVYLIRMCIIKICMTKTVTKNAVCREV